MLKLKFQRDFKHDKLSQYIVIVFLSVGQQGLCRYSLCQPQEFLRIREQNCGTEQSIIAKFVWSCATILKIRHFNVCTLFFFQREEQGDESEEFLDLFDESLRYIEGLFKINQKRVESQ